MDWMAGVEGTEALRSIFRDSEPDLAGVRLHEIALRQDGPSVLLRFDLRDYPDNPPAKWKSAAYNTVQVLLTLDVATQVVLNGWSTNNIGEIQITHAASGDFAVDFASSSSSLRVTCKFVRISKVSAYHDSERPAG